MEIYGSEDEQLDALKKWWKETGRSVVAGIAAGIVIVVGWNLWSNYKQSRAEQASLMYEQLADAIEQKQEETAEKLSERIVELHKGSPYAVFAQLYQAKLRVDAGDLGGAKGILQQVLETAKDANFKHVARLHLSRVLLAGEEYEAGLKLLSEMDPSKAGSFEAAYEELKGDLYVGLDRPAEARTAYERALAGGRGSPLLPMKIDDVTAPDVMEPPE